MISKPIAQALVLTGGLLAGAVGLTLARRADLIDPDTTQRALMVLLGVVMLFYANDIPKAVIKKTPRGQAMQRTAARALVLAYLAWVAAWIFAPLDLANGLAMVPVALAALWIGLACVRSRAPAA